MALRPNETIVEFAERMREEGRVEERERADAAETLAYVTFLLIHRTRALSRFPSCSDEAFMGFQARWMC